MFRVYAIGLVIWFMQMEDSNLSRRTFLTTTLAATAAAPAILSAVAKPNIPIGLEMFSVRNALKTDVMGTVKGVGAMGYQVVEFFAPYYDWTPDYAKQVRETMDASGLRCNSTHNGRANLEPAGLAKAIELNRILGARYIVMAHPGNVTTLDDWKRVAETLNEANKTLASENMHAGYHNHDLEWRPVDGQKPIELLATSTDHSVMLQLDVGTCVSTGNDPVAWIEKNPGRIRSLHLKDWSPDGEYKVLFGEGKSPWKQIFAAAESKGGAEYYLIEQEGSRFPEMETAQKCLAAYKSMRG
jgi:sugar phosphate isomerase/epimerase